MGTLAGMRKDSVSLCNKCGDSFSFDLRPMPSGLIELLRQGYVPMPAETATLKQSVLNDEKTLDELDSRIDTICAILERLRSARRDIHEHLEQFSGLVSPIRSLPNEILEAIFGYLSEEPIKFRDGKFCGSDMWCIRQVCIKWRVIATSKSSFWTRLHFHEFWISYYDDDDDDDEEEEEPIKYSETFMKLLLSLSCDAPLYVDFDGHNIYFSDPLNYLRKFAGENSHRIKSLTAVPKALATLAGISSLPLLDNFQVIDRNGTGIKTDGHPDCFWDAPNIRSVGFQGDNVPQSLGLSWESLSKVSLSTINSGQIGFICDNCPNLRHLRLNIRALSRRELDREAYCFSRIETFVMEGFHIGPDDDIAGFFDLLQFSVLERLEIGLEWTSNLRTLYTSLLNLLSRNSSTIERLHFTDFPPCEGSQILSILATVPRLRDFAYGLNPKFDQGYQFFYDLLGSAPDAIVPNLEDLSLQGNKLRIQPCILDCLNRRMESLTGSGIGPFRRLSLTFADLEFEGNVLADLERLRCNGLFVCINNVYSNW